jgi:hypothetical protein
VECCAIAAAHPNRSNVVMPHDNVLVLFISPIVQSPGTLAFCPQRGYAAPCRDLGAVDHASAEENTMQK